MAAKHPPVRSFIRIEKQQLQTLFDVLRSAGYRTIGPRIADGAIVYRDLDSIEQLPLGYQDFQDGGTYRLERVEGAGHFDYGVGPSSLKNFLFPSRETLLECTRNNDTWTMSIPPQDALPLAILGVRPCELAALAVQDKIFLGGPYFDPGYQARRQQLFLVAVNCRRASATCFCHSMNTGPQAKRGFDLALTELDHYFVFEVGTPRGGEIISQTDWAPCTLQDMEATETVSRTLKQRMNARSAPGNASTGQNGVRQRYLKTTDIHDLLIENLEHPRWSDVARRCLACANCTMVCPTCFCSSVEEVADLAGDHVLRERTWDSCFTAEHSYMNTGTVRKSTASRYRQWLTHKLATWIDQFGTSGCVGCGRCITWCPVGIDLTEEVAAIRGESAP